LTFSMKPVPDVSAFRNASKKDEWHPAVVLSTTPKGLVRLVVRPPVQPGEPWEGVMAPQPGAAYRVGQQVSVKVKSAQPKTGRLTLSWV